jgi:uncharacterized membrane protein YeaQ/YmgE (transglycosylase-associated protein family)
MTTASLLTGFLVSTIGGAVVLWLLITKLAWANLAKHHPNAATKGVGHSLTVPLGIVERGLYTAAILFGFLGWIAVWLAFKVAVAWPHKIRKPPSDNLYLIGNALSVAISFLGAVIAHGSFPPWGPK